MPGEILPDLRWTLDDRDLSRSGVGEYNEDDYPLEIIRQKVIEYVDQPVHLIPDSQGNVTIEIIGIGTYIYPVKDLVTGRDVVGALSTIMQTPWTEDELKQLYGIPSNQPISSNRELQSLLNFHRITKDQVRTHHLMGNHIFFEGLAPTQEQGHYELFAGS